MCFFKNITLQQRGNINNIIDFSGNYIGFNELLSMKAQLHGSDLFYIFERENIKIFDKDNTIDFLNGKLYFARKDNNKDLAKHYNDLIHMVENGKSEYVYILENNNGAFTCRRLTKKRMQEHYNKYIK